MNLIPPPSDGHRSICSQFQHSEASCRRIMTWRPAWAVLWDPVSNMQITLQNNKIKKWDSLRRLHIISWKCPNSVLSTMGSFKKTLHSLHCTSRNFAKSINILRNFRSHKSLAVFLQNTPSLAFWDEFLVIVNITVLLWPLIKFIFQKVLFTKELSTRLRCQSLVTTVPFAGGCTPW